MPNPFYANKWFYFKQFSCALVHSLMSKAFLFQATYFSIRTQFSSISPIDRTLSGVIRVYLGVMVIKGYSCIAGASPADCWMSYPGHSLGKSTEMQPTGPPSSVVIFTVVRKEILVWSLCFDIAKHRRYQRKNIFCVSTEENWHIMIFGKRYEWWPLMEFLTMRVIFCLEI